MVAPLYSGPFSLMGWHVGGPARVHARKGLMTSAKVHCLRLVSIALLGGGLLTPEVRAELLTTVPSDWEESDGYGLGIEQVTSLMGQTPSPCGPAWGHLGFAMGHTTIALSSESGDRQVVVCVNSLVMSDETWKALGDLVWAGYCGYA